MMPVVVYLLICIVILLCTDQKDRTNTAGRMLVVGLLLALLSKLPFDPFTVLWAIIVAVFHLAMEHLRFTIFLAIGLVLIFYVGVFVYAGSKGLHDNKEHKQ